MIDKTFIRENQLAVVGFCILLGMVFAAVIASGAFMAGKKYTDEVISVTGSATKMISSDDASWTGTFSRRGNSMSEAYNKLKGDTQIVKEFIKSQGLDDKAIELSSISTNTLYGRDTNGNSTNSVEGYDLTQSITIHSPNVDLVEDMANSSNELINKGLTFVSGSPQFFYTKLDTLKVDMLKEATQNAKSRAESMVKATGNGIGQIRSAQMGVFQITSPNSTDVSDYGVNDTSSKEKKVMAVVNASFSVH